MTRALWILGLAGFGGGLIALVLALSSDHTEERWDALVFAPLIAWSFIGTGLYAWARRPENRIGSLMVLLGFSWLLTALALSDTPELYTAGLAFSLLPYAVLAHLLLAFPDGRLPSRAARAITVVGYLTVTLVQWAYMLVFDYTRDGCDCPENLLLISREDDVADAIALAQELIGIALLTALVYLMWRRWREATPAQRRAVAPAIGAGLATIATLFVTLIADLVDLNDSIEAAVDIGTHFTLVAVPLGFLVGVLRSRLSRASAVSALMERLAERPRSLRDALADALDEPDLGLAFRRDGGGWVDAAGRAIALPESHTPVEREGRVVGALIHSAALAEEDRDALRTIAAAAGLALENERLEAELRARIEELRESRARLVEATDASRRRIERDLHDGAQQRLVALALTLRLASQRVDEPLLDEAIAELGEATAELRELARGIHPAILSDRGLGPALEALAGRSPVPVELEQLPDERLPAPVESAAYFLVAEALTNVGRYAQAQSAAVKVARENGQVVVEVRDDGCGGADPSAGSGLRGLADRVAALDGRLEIASPLGAGTTIRAEIPCAS